MQRVTPDRCWPLFDRAATRALERRAAASLPPHEAMLRAGLAVARLAQAIAPHARTVWLACGPGNNGGDGLEAAMHLAHAGRHAVVTWSGQEATMPEDARVSLGRARAAGVDFRSEPPHDFDMAIDAMLGVGHARALQSTMAGWAARLREAATPVLAVDLPSGLDADTGNGDAVRATHTLSLLTLKPGLYMAQGRDACGEIWFDDLGIAAGAPAIWLSGPAMQAVRPHASHKGSHGDVAVIGGAPGMAGAALLAASAALHAGAGRVMACLLDSTGAALDPAQPELMLRDWQALDLTAMHVVCGCGGGDAVRAVLPHVLAAARNLVLDADALNAVAADTQLASLLAARGRRGERPTVLTPHPFEAARLLGMSTQAVQADRLAAARALVQRFGCTVVLKGSGSVVASPGGALSVNPTGNARLATAGTGDVLAGMVGAHLAQGLGGQAAASAAVFRHGLAADLWPASEILTASRLARCG